MILSALIAATVILFAFGVCSCGLANDAAQWPPFTVADSTFLDNLGANIDSLQGFMIAQIAALLAICITVFVFLFTELNARAQDHPGERVICNGLQKDFALRVERLSIDSILLLVFNYWAGSIYNLSNGTVNYGHALYALLMASSLWLSICMIWYCVDVAQYQRHLRWRAWNLTKERFGALEEIDQRNDNAPRNGTMVKETEEVSAFWSEYRTVDMLVRTIAGTPEAMTRETIAQFKEVTALGSQDTDDHVIEMLNKLYDYQAALHVLDVYSDEARGNIEDRNSYGLCTIVAILNIVDWLLGVWNRRVRKKPEDARSDGRPGITDESSPTAVEITRRVWELIVQGDRGYNPMESQRMHDMALTGLDFSNGRLRGATFTECRLVRASFKKADVRGVKFERCNLRDASFQLSHCSGVLFDDCDLGKMQITDRDRSVIPRNSMLLTSREKNGTAGIVLTKCSMPGSFLIGSGEDALLDLSNASFAGSNLSGSKIQFAYLSQATFSHTQMSDHLLISDCEGKALSFEGAQFIDSKMQKCTFERSSLAGCYLSHASIVGCKLPHLNASGTIFEDLEMEESTLKNASLAKAAILYADIRDTTISDTDLSNARILDSKVQSSIFSRVTGNSFSLSYSDTKGLKVVNANLVRASFIHAVFTDCHFERTTLDKSMLRDAVFVRTPFESVRIADADCSDARFESLSLSRTIADGVLFDRASLTHLTVTDSSLRNVSMTGTRLYSCTFTSCDMKGTVFAGAFLANCRFDTTTRDERTELVAALRKASALNKVYVDGESVVL